MPITPGYQPGGPHEYDVKTLKFTRKIYWLVIVQVIIALAILGLTLYGLLV